MRYSRLRSTFLTFALTLRVFEVLADAAVTGATKLAHSATTKEPSSDDRAAAEIRLRSNANGPFSFS
jgi:hypothetical protein